MSELIEQLKDLHKQAITERSHYYVATCVESAIKEITQLQDQLSKVTADRDKAVEDEKQWCIRIAMAHGNKQVSPAAHDAAMEIYEALRNKE